MNFSDLTVNQIKKELEELLNLPEKPEGMFIGMSDANYFTGTYIWGGLNDVVQFAGFYGVDDLYHINKISM